MAIGGMLDWDGGWRRGPICENAMYIVIEIFRPSWMSWKGR